MLIVVEDRDIALFLELSLDLKAAGRRDILQIDAAEAAGDQVDRLDKFIHILCLHAKGKGIDAAKGFKEHAFALHDRHPRFGANIAEAQDSRAIGDHSAQVVPPGQVIGLRTVLLDLQAWLGNAGGIGQSEVLLAPDRHRRRHLDLSLPLLVQPQRLLCIIHKCALTFGNCTAALAAEKSAEQCAAHSLAGPILTGL